MKDPKKYLSELPDNKFNELVSMVSAEKTRRKKLRKVEFVASKEENKPIDQIKAFSLNCELRSLLGLGNSICHRMKYYKALICQDWSSIYPRDTSFGDYYVYAHVDPRKPSFTPGKNFGGSLPGTPFYIGKGIGNRAFDLKRNEGHGRVLKTLFSLEYKPEHIVFIMFDGLSENKAYEIEAKLIYFFGTIFQKDRSKGALVNLDIPQIPKYKKSMVPSDKHVKDKEIAALGVIDI